MKVFLSTVCTDNSNGRGNKIQTGKPFTIDPVLIQMWQALTLCATRIITKQGVFVIPVSVEAFEGALSEVEKGYSSSWQNLERIKTVNLPAYYGSREETNLSKEEFEIIAAKLGLKASVSFTSDLNCIGYGLGLENYDPKDADYFNLHIFRDGMVSLVYMDTGRGNVFPEIQKTQIEAIKIYLKTIGYNLNVKRHPKNVK